MSAPDYSKLKFPNIARACFEICVDSGGINRAESVTKWAGEYAAFIQLGWPTAMLQEIDTWLGTLTDAELQIVCGGEDTEAAQLMKSSPAFANEFLNDYFEYC